MLSLPFLQIMKFNQNLTYYGKKNCKPIYKKNNFKLFISQDENHNEEINYAAQLVYILSETIYR